jgi:hypothetical protein
MAKKRRKKHRRARRANPKRRALKRRRHRRANPTTRRRRHRRAFGRKAKRNPGRRRHRVRGHFAKKGRKRTRVRAHMSNPKRRRAFGGRRRRRNPGGFFGDLALAVLAGIGGFVGTFVLGYFITPATQMVEKGQLYRGGVGLAGAAGGAYLAKKHPLAGAALAVGSLLGAFGGFLTLQVLKVLPQKSAGTNQVPTTKGLGAVFNNNMAGYNQQMGAVFNNNLAGYRQMQGYQQQQMGAVFNNNMLGMGDLGASYTPPAPWLDRTPYDSPAGY